VVLFHVTGPIFYADVRDHIIGCVDDVFHWIRPVVLATSKAVYTLG